MNYLILIITDCIILIKGNIPYCLIFIIILILKTNNNDETNFKQISK